MCVFLAKCFISTTNAHDLLLYDRILHLEGSETAFSGVMYRTSYRPFSASLLTELFIWVLPRYSDFTPRCCKLMTCFQSTKPFLSKQIRSEQSTKNVILYLALYLVLHQWQKRAYNNSCLLCNQWRDLIAAMKTIVVRKLCFQSTQEKLLTSNWKQEHIFFTSKGLHEDLQMFNNFHLLK